MTRRFSIREAIGEPFRLAFQRPWATVAWGLVMIVPSLIIFAGMGPFIEEMLTSGALITAGTPPAGGDLTSFNDLMMLQAWSGLSQLLSLLALLMVTTAVIRAVLRGRRKDRFAFLRLSKDEFYVAVIGIAIAAGVGVVFVVGALIIAAFGIAAAGTGASWAAWTAVALGFALALGLALLWGRLSLIAPTAVVTGELAFEAGWRAGRGQTGRLFVMMLALVAVTILLALGMMVLFVLAAVIFGGGLHNWADEAAVEAWLLEQLNSPGLLIAISAALAIPLAWVQGFSSALWIAPFAVAARDLAPRADDGGAGVIGDAL